MPFHGRRVYLQFSASSLPDLPQRVTYAVGPGLDSTLNQSRLLGYGLGSMAPGNQHIGAHPPLYVEGGLHRVIVEGGWIGLAGFLLVLILLVRIGATALWRSARQADSALLAAVLLGCGAGQLCCFFVGQQVFGDPNVLMTTGVLFGMGLACAHADRELRDPQRLCVCVL
jgi:O-antigen ligase